MSRLVIGACLSLTGRYSRFGRQAADGLKAWRALMGDDVEVRVEDDGSDPERIAPDLRQLATECDLLLGPYSTQLMREAGRAIAELDVVASQRFPGSQPVGRLPSKTAISAGQRQTRTNDRPAHRIATS